MVWVRLDDVFPENPKVAGLSDRAFRVHVSGICYAAKNLTDGMVPAAMAARFLATKRVTGELERAGLWHRTEEGWEIHDFLHYQPSRSQVEAERAAARERMANRRGSSGNVRPNIERTSPEVQLPRPDPVPINDSLRSSLAAAESDDTGFRDRYGTLVTAFGGHLDQRAADEFTQIAEDWTDIEAINAAIRACRRDNKRPWPSEIRSRLPELPKPAKARPKRPDEPMSLDEFRAIAMADGGNS